MKKELIEKITSRCLGKIAKEHIKQILSEELPDFQRIDEERFLRIYRRNYTINIDDAIKEYNSTLPPALKPLPKEMPEWFAPHMTRAELWDQVVSYYGTPEPKPSLPTVEELAKEMLNVWNVNTFNEVAEYVINKYSLHAREWWQDLKEGDKFMFEGKVRRFQRFVLESRDRYCGLSDCTPYTPPTASEIIAKHNLSEEEVKAIREGKG